MSELRVADLINFLETKVPKKMKESWDSVGLIAGDSNEPIKGVVVTIDLGLEALKLAISSGSNVIVCHHPPLFKKTDRVTSEDQSFIYQAIRNGIQVFCLHANYDLISVDTNKEIAQSLGCSYEGPLVPVNSTHQNDQAKFVTYIPKEFVSELRSALAEVGAGQIGQYTHCSFSISGQGSFKGSELSHPVIGQSKQLEFVDEVRFEMIVPRSLIELVVDVAKKNHPYEEMAYEVFDLNLPKLNFGYGWRGLLTEGLSLDELALRIKSSFQLKTVTLVRSSLKDSFVRQVGFTPGSGKSFLSDVLKSNIDVYITGEVDYHNQLEARQKGLHLFLLGHSNSEVFFLRTLTNWLMKFFRNMSQAIPVLQVKENIEEFL